MQTRPYREFCLPALGEARHIPKSAQVAAFFAAVLGGHHRFFPRPTPRSHPCAIATLPQKPQMCSSVIRNRPQLVRQHTIRIRPNVRLSIHHLELHDYCVLQIFRFPCPSSPGLVSAFSSCFACTSDHQFATATLESNPRDITEG